MVAPTIGASKDEPLIANVTLLGTTRSMSPDLLDPWSPPGVVVVVVLGFGLCLDHGFGQTPPLVSKRLELTLLDTSR